MNEIPEEIRTPESGSKHYPITIILQRHGETETSPTVTDTEEIKTKAGWLTKKGAEDTRRTAESVGGRILDEALAKHTPVTFFFLNSNTAWFVGDYPYGRRAEQTARVSAEEIEKLIRERDLPSDQAEVHRFNKQDALKILHDSPRLKEPNYWYVEEAKDPEAYIRALRKKYPDDPEKGFQLMDPELEKIRRQTGAQSSREVARSTILLMRAIERHARQFSQKHPGRQLVFWLDTHSDRMRSTLQYGLGVEGGMNHPFRSNEVLEMQLADGVLTTTFKDKVYTIKLKSV